MTELLGYLGSALVVVSLTMRSLLRLRIISLAGSATFLVYGLLIESWPIVITNAAIAVINLWYLRIEYLVRRSGHGDLGVSRIRVDSPFLVDFVRYHLDDIRRFQPDFDRLPATNEDDRHVALLLTRDGLPAGLVLGRRDGDALWIELDYVLREHRDSRLGSWLYGTGAQVFRDLGASVLKAEALTVTHDRYLTRMGFADDPDDTGYALAL
ncbi:MAG: hypothetical protein AAF945_19505 [Actinomycetota bacterium]